MLAFPLENTGSAIEADNKHSPANETTLFLIVQAEELVSEKNIVRYSRVLEVTEFVVSGIQCTMMQKVYVLIKYLSRKACVV